ncbi:MAG: PKD domain-containing protein, partial [Thermoplasmata archaeon]
SINFTKVYDKKGDYNITVEAWDNDGDSTISYSYAFVSEAEEPSGAFWDSIIAIALIIFVALLGVLVGHFTGYYRIGREHEGKERAEEPEPEPVEEEEEPEQTAEEIISELEEDLDDEGDRDYFDHEPTVAELEEMIPRDDE